MNASEATVTSNYRLFVNAERTLLVRFWADDKTVEVATRDNSYEIWGPPVYLTEEKT